jgi:hypothetical protein
MINLSRGEVVTESYSPNDVTRGETFPERCLTPGNRRRYSSLDSTIDELLELPGR